MCRSRCGQADLPCEGLVFVVSIATDPIVTFRLRSDVGVDVKPCRVGGRQALRTVQKGSMIRSEIRKDEFRKCAEQKVISTLKKAVEVAERCHRAPFQGKAMEQRSFQHD